MKFVEIIEKNISKTINSIAAKNRKLAFLNRIRLSLRTEYETLNDAYVKLGKYYYKNLRYNDNENNKALCNVIDGCVANIERLKDEYYGTMSAEYSDPTDDELDVEIFEMPNDEDESAFIKEIESVLEDEAVKPIDGEAADDDTEENSDEAAPVEDEESSDEAAPVEDEESSDEAAPVEDEESSDEAAPVEDEESSDEAAPVEDEESSDEAVPVEDEECSDEAAPVEDEGSSDEAAPNEDEERSDESAPNENEENSDEAAPDNEDEESSDEAADSEDEEISNKSDDESDSEETKQASNDVNYEDDKKDSADDIVASIKDISDADDFVISNSFENLGDNVSVLDIKKDDEDRNIHITSDSPEDIIAIAYSQVGGKKVTDLNNDSLEDVINNIFGNDIVVDEIVDNEIGDEIGYTDDQVDDTPNNDDPYIISNFYDEESYKNRTDNYEATAGMSQIEDTNYHVSEAVDNNTVSEEYIEDNVPENIDSVNPTKEDLQNILENYFGPDDYNIGANPQNFKSFVNWNKFSDSLADDISYICNNNPDNNVEG
ncbi:MAG: hypothetical protein ACI4II_08585 [Acutalibacteraceae bacterium]